MRYGFLIDQNRCIGCHACTVACKEEHNVPLGVFRTWVKYIDRGEFPDARRTFSVLRCNHCDDAPCITICPTNALFRRDNGIVDFDGDRCIGCKACMQACPYDALYIDPATQTAAKCNFCAHRVEVGLEPACVIVCPVQAIVAGDLDDPMSRISTIIAAEKIEVRKPEQKTKPKLFYTGLDADALAPRSSSQQMFSLDASAADLTDGARVAYDVPHARAPWGWKVSTYLWTKSISAGALLLAGLAYAFKRADGPFGVEAALVALVFLAITTALLVFDLKRPERFLFILFKGNPRSWLYLGTWALMGFGGVATLWLFGVRWAWPAILLSAAAAGYSAFLFMQAEGRDFWQSRLLLVHLLVAAVVAGAAALTLVDATDDLELTLAVGLISNLAIVFAELAHPRRDPDARRGAAIVLRDPAFWLGAIGLGTLLPLGLLGLGLAPSAAVLALAGLWIYEDLWIRAGQAVPLS